MEAACNSETPVRACVFDEETKQLRMPKTYRSTGESLNHTVSNLSVDAVAFVPSVLQHHQQSRIQNNYSQKLPHQEQQHTYGSSGHYNHSQLQHHPVIGSGSVQNRLRINNHINNVGEQSPAVYYQNRHSQQQNHQHQLSNHNNHNQQRQHQQHYSYNKYDGNQGYQQYNHNNHHQNHHRHQQQQQQAINNESGASPEGANDMENIALDYLQTVIHCLNQNPGQFDAIATRFLTIFEGMENNTFVLSNAMEDIFNESIKNPNFRYMGAKLYNLLHMLNPRKDSLFHTLLKCKLDFHQNEVKEYIKTNQQNKVRETALFLAELYMQLRGEEFRIHLIAENIVYSLKQLLSKENADNVRCICLTLKLAGYDLTADCPGDMKEIIVELNDINNKSPGKYPLAANVISLEKNNWGRKISGSESPIEGNKLMEPPRSSDDPVFYGPDGSVITDEECEFLTISANGIPGSIDNDEIDNDSDVDLDPEMDEETEHAYKEFIRQSANS
ncbi:polyadenylate-binding protein-interacting protein 1-like [Glossina fuscipes]|uniref:MIF4G domain-containing protein n=2 Tax=Nemorhina TaxID=44051 RepID=A0A1B0C177_9MUSC|nr:polyadenylate-binding protein-interacting protein 1-like [Glossina fuscipes]XP_037894803.1 polyadenylate-binding protein-interacting protein 1-like [Glossina fuscipes]XP_037894804.1 polyadenylate-binding protein-interacting protein 1-like [Glossina fuscipes]XP_037894805.1 polyadenylate-binding protein-interacting protein 1-like [Glossina fuscipes]KAI9578369.1 hypothetical protein GQX74_004923 [Glossina fuscipes]